MSDNPHKGTNFYDYLKEEGIYEKVSETMRQKYGGPVILNHNTYKSESSPTDRKVKTEVVIGEPIQFDEVLKEVIVNHKALDWNPVGICQCSKWQLLWHSIKNLFRRV